MTDPTPIPSGASADRTLMIILAYLWLLALVPLLLDTRDAEVRWHAKHGIILTIVEFVIMIAWTILTSVLWIMTAGLLGCLFVVFSPFLVLAIVVLHVIAIAKAIRGQRLIIPGISDFADRF
jgi:uncharacterized membrane protein